MAEMKSITLNGKKYDSFVDAEARQLIKNMGNGQPGGTVTDEQIEQAVVDYLTKNPVEGGMTKKEKDLILSLFRNAAYTSANMGSTLANLEALWNGGEAPEEPDEPVVTLTRITATYSGGSVPVGTAVSALTGVVVTAHYSDGSSKTVTGYTLSGTIVEGSNIIMVSYGGMSTTFTVTGVAEEPEEPDVPDVPAEKTLTSISAAYSGGEVLLGTTVDDLTGITVVATYSDGSTEYVTDYTLSGTIAIGNNVITVSYEGKTTTFAVTCVYKKYSVTNNLTNASTSNNASSANEGSIYIATITPNVGYELSNVTVTMGGVDITSDVYSNGVVNIPSVTGAIVITVTTANTNVLYRLENRTFDGTAASVIDTGIELLATDSDFTIMIDAVQGDITPFAVGNVNCAIFSCTKSASPWGGILLQTNDKGLLQTKWMSQENNSLECNKTGCRIKAVVTHAKGSGTATYKVKIDNNAVSELLLTEAFAPIVRRFGIGGSNTGGNPWVGTMNSFTIYNNVQDDATISAFLA